MIKKWILIAAIAGLSSSGLAADRVGLAEGRDGFFITREDSALQQRANVPTAVLAGDVVTVGERPVRVQLNGGDSVLMSADANAAFNAESVSLTSGITAVALSADSGTQVVSNGIAFSTPRAVEGQSIFLVSPKGSRVVVEGHIQTVSLTDAETGEQIGFVSSGDRALVYKGENGWVMAAPGSGQPAEASAVGVEGANVLTATEAGTGEEGAALAGALFAPGGTGVGATTAGVGGIGGVAGVAGGGAAGVTGAGATAAAIGGGGLIIGGGILAAGGDDGSTGSGFTSDIGPFF